MKDYKSKLGNLADKIKNETPNTPIQQVSPVPAVNTDVPAVEARFNNWIPKDLKRKIKAFSAEYDISQKDITIQALRDFLKLNGIENV